MSVDCILAVCVCVCGVVGASFRKASARGRSLREAVQNLAPSVEIFYSFLFSPFPSAS